MSRPADIDLTTETGVAWGPDDLMTPGEVAALFRVDPKTVTRWHKTGRLIAIRTIGGHRRFMRWQIRELLTGSAEPRPTPQNMPPARSAPPGARNAGPGYS